jgi:hypothetical protein
MRGWRRLPAVLLTVLIAMAGLATGTLLTWVGPSWDRLHEAVTAPRHLAASQGADAFAVAVVGALAWLVLGWLVLAVLLTVLSRLPGVIGRASSAVARRTVPAAARRVLAGTLGLSLVGGTGVGLLTGSASAATRPATSTADTTAPSAASVELGWDGGSRAPPSTNPSVDLGWDAAVPWTPPPPPVSQEPFPVVPPPTPLPGPELRGTAPDDAHVVTRGESLWSIARDHLGEGATDRQIDAEWPRWYQANRQVIGDDPDHILPGMRLTPPAAD